MGTALDDTICAIATAVGEGGIGIVRVSGRQAIATASLLLRLRSGRPLAAAESHRLAPADLIQPTADGQSQLLDEALVAVMRAPHSYTGEDVVEVQCHGSPYVLHTVCAALIQAGARLAEPGEFTKRAFLNGRLDLTQAEAVLDTIHAKTAGSLRLAQAQLRGTLSGTIDRLRDQLLTLLAHVEAGIDFTEEDLTFVSREQLRQGVTAVLDTTRRVLDGSREGRILREGAAVAIVGRPNVGKSSLLNALLEHDRAIVTPIPGTTRDVLEELLNIRGVPVRLVDTAGVRETTDPIEQEGVRRTHQAIEEADLLLLVLDRAVPLTAEDCSLLARYQGRRRLLVLNKVDLPTGLDHETLQPYRDEACAGILGVSAKSGEGLDTFRDRLRAVVVRPDFEPAETPVATRLRHQTALAQATDALAHCLASIDRQLSPEFIAMDLRGALDALGEITGAVTTEDVLERIFNEFCIGK